jgi:hypothetical protein
MIGSAGSVTILSPNNRANIWQLFYILPRIEMAGMAGVAKLS